MINVKDLILCTLGIGSSYNTLDEVCEAFDVDVDCEDVERALENCCGGDFSGFANLLAENVLCKVLCEFNIELGENGWSADINCDIVRLYHNGEIISNKAMIEEIVGAEMDLDRFDENADYLEKNDIKLVQQRVWWDKPYSAELETYTNAGEDMLIDLEVLDKEHLEEYIDGFDINEEVMNWWRDGEDKARANGVPHATIADHYQDYEEYLDTLREVCKNMPY